MKTYHYDLSIGEVGTIVVALNQYAKKLFEESGEDLEDAGNDILYVQALLKALQDGCPDLKG
ncbi:hypothetical protein V8J88_01570 [Massilia sp. W12]|uniref:hypothetical protein n=1 Tax=Massilia sp. W12 TaxID=3126507 RepID=UPI0030CC8E54